MNLKESGNLFLYKNILLLRSSSIFNFYFEVFIKCSCLLIFVVCFDEKENSVKDLELLI